MARYFWEQNPGELFVLSAGPAWCLPPDELIPTVTRFPIDFDRIMSENIFYHLFDDAFEYAFMEAFYKINPGIFIVHDIIDIPARLMARIKKETGIPIIMVLHNLYPFCQKLHLFRYPPAKVGLCNGLSDTRECVGCLSDFYYRGQKLHAGEETELLKFSNWRREYLSCIYRLADQLIAPSQFIKDSFEKALEKPVQLIRNGLLPLPPLPSLSPSPSLPGDENRPAVFAFMGLADLAKGILVALKAFSACTTDKARFLVYGEMSPQTPLPPAATFKPALKNIEFRGPYQREDLANIYQEIDVAVLPSYFENYPTAVLEAFHYQTPVITCRTGGVPELVTHGKNGLFFTPGNWRELLQHIESLAGNREAISALQKNIPSQRDYREMGQELETVMAGISFAKPDKTNGDLQRSLRYLSGLEKKINTLPFLPKRNFFALSRDIKRDTLPSPFRLAKMQRRPYSPLDLLIEKRLENTATTNPAPRKKHTHHAPMTAADYFSWAAYFLESGALSTGMKMMRRLYRYGPFFAQYPQVLIYLGEQERKKNSPHGHSLIKQGLALLAGKTNPDLNDLHLLFEKHFDLGEYGEAQSWLEKLQRYETNVPDYFLDACFRFADTLRLHDRPNWENWIQKGMQTLARLEVSGDLPLMRMLQAEYYESAVGHMEAAHTWRMHISERAGWLEAPHCEQLCRHFGGLTVPPTLEITGEIPPDKHLRAMALFLFKHAETTPDETDRSRMIHQGVACLFLLKKKVALDYYWAASFLKRNGQFGQALALFKRVIRKTKPEAGKIKAGAYYHIAEIHCANVRVRPCSSVATLTSRQIKRYLLKCLHCEPHHEKAKQLLRSLE
ncbi:MAG TPA: glycosyltransferase [Candidatus Deferrimicrobium sp.]|nr:glycosyltransferase [Candidatus Deferrimicrobium sp.]